MKYQQTKTIQKYSINKNLLLIGLLVFATVLQGCGGSGKSSKGGSKGSNPALQALLGEWPGMTAQDFLSKVGQDAKDCHKDPNKAIKTIKFASGHEETLKLPTKVEMTDPATQKTKAVPYFTALIGKLVKKGKIKGEQVEENEAITGLFKKVLDEFKEDNNDDKNAKIFVLHQLLVLKEQENIGEFVEAVAKVKHEANGVLVKIDASGNVSFRDLTEADKKQKKNKYVLSKDLSKFIEDDIVKPIQTLNTPK